ncbi:MAG: TlpA family protein disulfide reductase [Vicinamibacterales bacterium]
MAEDYAEIFAFPATFLVDRNGNVVKHVEGPVEEADIKAAVKSLVDAR